MIYMASVDVVKSFDSIKHDKLMTVLDTLLTEQDYYLRRCSVARLLPATSSRDLLSATSSRAPPAAPSGAGVEHGEGHRREEGKTAKIRGGSTGGGGSVGEGGGGETGGGGKGGGGEGGWGGGGGTGDSSHKVSENSRAQAGARVGGGKWNSGCLVGAAGRRGTGVRFEMRAQKCSVLCVS